MDIKKIFGERFISQSLKLKVGMKAPECDLMSQHFSKVKLLENSHKVLLIGVFPSVDIEKCSKEIHRLDVESYIMDDKVDVTVVTGDNPFNLFRFSFEKDIEHVRLLSDSQNHSFTRSYGFLLDDLLLPSKGLIVVDKSQTIRYVSYCESMEEEMNFLEAIKIVKENN